MSSKSCPEQQKTDRRDRRKQASRRRSAALPCKPTANSRWRALTRNPGKHRGLADEVVEADLNRPETLAAAFEGAHGVFLVTNFWEAGTDESKQATAAVARRRKAGVKHFVWSTLPDVEAISGGKFHVPHFHRQGPDRPDRRARPGSRIIRLSSRLFFYQNLVGVMTPQKQPMDRWLGPSSRSSGARHPHGRHRELGGLVAGAFAHPDQAGNGEYLPLVGDLMSFNDVVDTLNRQGHALSFKQVPKDVFAASFSWRRRDRGDARLLPGSYLPGRRFVRPIRARQQDRGPAADPALRLGPGEFPGPGTFNPKSA